MLLLLCLLLSVCLRGSWCSRAILFCSDKCSSSTSVQLNCMKKLNESPLHKIAKLSLSPWTYEVVEYPDMCPRLVVQARCTTSLCQGGRSFPIVSTIPVLFFRPVGRGQPPHLQPGLFNITTGCTCVRWEGSAHK